jgi:hypothetical protein
MMATRRLKPVPTAKAHVKYVTPHVRMLLEQPLFAAMAIPTMRMRLVTIVTVSQKIAATGNQHATFARVAV